ncbi:TrkH family potassium uptake protein [Eggerthia catenaformis]|uniref:TrkH family potassium uptake protein n=1 Tax=Eggerthia catenaformis TaxID=31973 RepID=UPI00248D3FBD|nr:potassium transporter TrkG [Eggerthia catenaformis]
MDNQLIRHKRKIHLSATQKIALSFAMMIFVGSILLSLPIANKTVPRTYIDNLFIATSCVCVTGLTPFTVVDQYNLFGQLVMMVLIQFGGLGFLSFLYLFLNAARRTIKLQTKLVFTEALNQDSLSNLPRLLKTIFYYTAFIESFGMIVLSFFFVPKYGFVKGIYYGLWHSISGFCNAGFDLIGGNSFIDYATHPIINFIIPFLIITGGIGFIVILDMYDKFKKEKSRHDDFHLKRYIKSLAVHSKLALSMTAILLVSGTVLFIALEFNNVKTIGTLSIPNKLAVSFFQSVTTRTAGFATVSMFNLNRITKTVMCIFMFIGGSPASTAGGVKTVTIALVILMLKSVFKGQEETSVFRRRIKKRIFLKAFSIVSIGLILCLISIMILVAIEPKLDVLNIMLEVFSAFGTVGLSADVTPALNFFGKVIDIILMYAGRIGPVTLMILFTRQAHIKEKGIRYPDEDVIVG